jgi:hypothetical protein
MPDAITTQLVFDCADPHRMAAFWASALHYEHEAIEDFVQGMVDAGHVPADITIEVGGKRRWRDIASIRHPDDGVDERGVGTGRRILFETVPEGKTTKNRVHLDLRVGREANDAEVDRLVALGATKVDVHDGPEGYWVLLRDPEGNELDVA